jgi:tetratricopeptide (TPR) repeat protein
MDWDDVAELAGSIPELEARLIDQPDDVRARVQLVKLYMFEILDRDAQHRRHDHVFWLIDHAPGVWTSFAWINATLWPDAYREANARWRAAVTRHPDDPDVLYNAMLHASLGDPTAAEELGQRGAALEPAAARWQASLGFRRATAWFAATSEEERVRLAREALAFYERAYELEGGHGHLAEIAKAASRAGDHERARATAARILAEASTDDPDAYRHHARAVLGRVMLARGDVAGAIEQLARSLDDVEYFAAGLVLGPDLTLARDLLNAGEQGAVIEYLDGCIERAWPHADDVELWKAAIARGEIPSLRLEVFERMTRALAAR